MQKDFDTWNEKKKEVNGRVSAPFYCKREVWWCTLGINIGSEQDGSLKDNIRPVLILRSFGRTTCLIVPLTTSTQAHPLRVAIGSIEGKNAVALLSQMRVVDTKRLFKKIQLLDSGTFNIVRKIARGLL